VATVFLQRSIDQPPFSHGLDRLQQPLKLMGKQALGYLKQPANFFQLVAAPEQPLKVMGKQALGCLKQPANFFQLVAVTDILHTTTN
jgi:hypothetical protein